MTVEATNSRPKVAEMPAENLRCFFRALIDAVREEKKANEKDQDAT